MKVRHYLHQAPSVTAGEAIRLAREGALIIDVRRQFEWNRNHIPGSLHVPLEELSRRCEDLPEDRLLITFCTGGLRSYGAANMLIDYGFDAKNMSKGLVDWRAAGGALEGSAHTT
ncbi:rhodanese-like domain-containing protein [Aldersonia sp. NBC_00410]|uniref:rhodanese-like domain-containing protein n=1 Tax=Aldersonia sp. NBC_00410 TaxID=2975954 RepID=UPI0022562EDC|nr:rhodanese-like domain-containing protein [Aldersonia sp. NBC_00410]MCX5042696.1 rhodanese-like domain-containing protein [Aldersonia sp. NBC_00410]